MNAARVTLKVSLVTLATDTDTPSSQRVVLTAFLPSVWKVGKRKTRPAISRKLYWNAASPRI